MISHGDGVALASNNFKLRLESHVLKDEVTGKEYDFPLKNLTSIRTSVTEPTPEFLPPIHLQAPLNRELTDFNVHVKQDPETGDYLPPPKRKNLTPRNSRPLILSNANLNFMTNKLHNFRPRYADIIIDNVLAFPTADVTIMLPPCEGMAPKRSLLQPSLVHGQGRGVALLPQ
jgi:hypothetical protein